MSKEKSQLDVFELEETAQSLIQTPLSHRIVNVDHNKSKDELSLLNANNPVKKMPETSKPHYLGHRQRLRDRFIASDGTGMSDYELLELMLFRSIPRRDCKPLAKKMIASFGSITNVLAAKSSELTQIEGVSQNVAADIRLVHCLAKQMTRVEIKKDTPIFNDIEKVINYCRVIMGRERKENLRILYLDGKNSLISDELVSVGTLKKTAVYPREIIKRALDLHAGAMVLVHNHPSGECKPSQADIAVTARLSDVAEKIGISLLDHIIISHTHHISMREAGVVNFSSTKS